MNKVNKINKVNKVTIANLNLELSTMGTCFFERRLSEYRNDFFISKDMLLKTMACDEINEPQGTIIEQVHNVTIVHMKGDKYCRFARDKETGIPVTATYYNQDYSEVEIRLLEGREHHRFSLSDFEYMYTGFAFSDRLTEMGGAILHGSSIALGNQGIVFSANSGIGKSTHTQLWKEWFGDDVIIVNDDKPAIRFYDGIPYIFGTPWSGKTDLNTNIHVPLKAIVFIKRSETNRIELLNSRESIFCLSGQIERPYYGRAIGLKTMERIEELILTVPMYRLYCNVSREAAEVVFNEIYRKEGDIA